MKLISKIFRHMNLDFNVVVVLFLIGMKTGSAKVEGDYVPLGYDPARDVISDSFIIGPHLIYDCLKKHWGCSIKKCEKQKCVFFKSFPNKKSCTQQQLYVTSRAYEGEIFCDEKNKTK